MSDDWLSEDPFEDRADPEAAARAERRREREEKRRSGGGRRGRRKRRAEQAPPPPPAADPSTPEPPQEEPSPEEPAPSSPAVGPVPSEAGPVPEEPPRTAEPVSVPEQRASEPPSEEEPLPPPLPPRTPEEEFWDEPAAAEQGDSLAGHEEADDPHVYEEDATEAWAGPRTQAWELADEGLPPEQTPDPRGPGRADRDRIGGGGVLGTLRRHPFRIAFVIIAFFVFWFLYALFQPFHSGEGERVQVKVPKGASVSEVGDLLSEKGVIEDPILPISGSTLFQIRATIAGKRSSLYAGSFTLAKDMSYGDALDALTEPPTKRTVTVTVPEGYSRAQAAQLVEEDGIKGSYTKATVRSKYLDPASYGGKKAKNLEGFLFPDTFEMKPGAPVGHLVQLQLEDFKKRIKGVDMSYAKSKNLTVYDVLIIASMIEREAGLPGQRKLVAAVVYNRLHEGMPLGIDATIRFATGNYTKPLTESELAVDSPYNTRLNQGLPPGPINSPGLEAIEAAAHPAKKGYLFYVNKPNTCGELAFSKTDAEFQADVDRYNKAREANGGNEPTSCGE